MAKSNNKSKLKNQKAMALLIVGILLIAGIIGYIVFYMPEDDGDKVIVVEREIDDRISPLENQALTFEVLRIRHRGLYDKLLTRGRAWKTKPSFYPVLEIDDIIYGENGETMYTAWDTMFKEYKTSKDPVEEQETSDIKLTIFERISSGIIFKKSSDVERESLSFTYDYRTGRWTGDDYFKDEDGMGHYIGETFEVWFNIYQGDYDKDFIPYWTEVNVLGTDPRVDDSKRDPDGDGIPTAWEWKYGYDPLVWDDHENLDPDVDGLENIEEYKMEKWLAEPFSQDIYCEIDYMGKGGFLDPPHYVEEESRQAIIEKYSEHNIKMFFDIGWPDTPKNGGGEVLPHFEGIGQDTGEVLQFYQHNFPDERKGIFRYVIANHGGPFNHPAKGNYYDVVSLGFKNDLKSLIKGLIRVHVFPSPRNLRIKVANLLMHELGHSVGISRRTIEGCDNVTFSGGKAAENHYKDTWGDYYSVMNYYHIYDMKLLDYSDGSNGPPYDQNDWLHLYLPNFQTPAEVVEEIDFHGPGFDKVVYAESELGVTGYVYDENLTEEWVTKNSVESPVSPIQSSFKVFKLEEEDKYSDCKDVKIYAQPNVMYAGWNLIWEGDFNSEGDIEFYSAESIIDEIMEELSSS